MTSIDLVPLAREHLKGFNPGLPDRSAFQEPYLSVLQGYWIGRAVCALDDQRQAVGIAGISVSDGCAYPWMVLSESARRLYPLRITRLARQVIDGLFEIERVDRIAVHVDRAFTAGRRWIERFGFSEQDSTQASMRYVRYGLTRATSREHSDRENRNRCCLDRRGRRRAQ